MESSHREGGREYFSFYFSALLFKMYHFRACDIFFSSSGYPINLIFQCRTYLLDVFDEAFFLMNMRMPLITKLFMVVTCGEDLSAINRNDI